jgi:hypothetical protein
LTSDSKRTYLGTVNCVHCETNEFRTDPNSKCYSHKHNGAGLTYEVLVDSGKTKSFGPALLFFTKRHKNEATWDVNALYFQIPEDKKLIGDSGYKGEPS